MSVASLLDRARESRYRCVMEILSSRWLVHLNSSFGGLTFTFLPH